MKTGTVVLPLIVWAASFCCSAQQVIYTCRDTRGGATYQDAPCATTGGRQEAARTFAIPHDPPDAARRLDAIDRQVHAEWARERAAMPIRSGGHRGASLPEGRTLQRRHCAVARERVAQAVHSRRQQADRARLEEDAIDACFAL